MMMPPDASPSLMIVAGEPSGDMHAAHVAREIRRLCPEVTLFGMGGGQMAAAGVELIYDIADSAVMGIAEVIASVPQFLRKLRHLAAIARERRPRAVLLVDFPDFNVRLAKRLTRCRIPVVYYIPPKAWAWRPWRARQVARLTTRVLSIFPFEAAFYEAAGARVTFVGHPLLDLVPMNLTREEARRSLGCPPDVPLVALLPGSRRKEIERLLPVLYETADRLRRELPETRFLLPLAPSVDPETIPPHPQVTIFQGRVYEVLRAADLGLIASGTATLEAACLGTPMIILYKVSASTWQIAKRMVRLQHSGLPNILAGREIVPEYLQEQAHPDVIAPTALALLRDEEARREQQQRLATVREQLGSPGAVRRAALQVLEVAHLRPSECSP